eukprot:scaffold227462_cov12-Tisochrysis_lutea.AAC.1
MKGLALWRRRACLVQAGLDKPRRMGRSWSKACIAGPEQVQCRMLHGHAYLNVHHGMSRWYPCLGLESLK